jgi:hypothetical protein
MGQTRVSAPASGTFTFGEALLMFGRGWLARLRLE